MLIKTLNEAYVPDTTTVSQLERMAQRFFEVNKISFNCNELPIDGVGHNRALHLTIKCEGHYVKIIMVDGGSRVDIFPLSTLQRLKINTDQIQYTIVYVNIFNKINRDNTGEIVLVPNSGSVNFQVAFLVLDMETSYNFLLKRTWIHNARSIPSTFY